MKSKCTILALVAVLFFTACKNETEENPLLNTKWKFTHFVDVTNQTSTVPDVLQLSPDSSYWLQFFEDESLQGRSSSNILLGFYTADLNGSDFAITTLGGTEVNELPDGFLFVESLHLVDSYTISGSTLKLHYNDNQNYLLFEAR